MSNPSLTIDYCQSLLLLVGVVQSAGTGGAGPGRTHEIPTSSSTSKSGFMGRFLGKGVYRWSRHSKTYLLYFPFYLSFAAFYWVFFCWVPPIFISIPILLIVQGGKSNKPNLLFNLKWEGYFYGFLTVGCNLKKKNALAISCVHVVPRPNTITDWIL